MLVEEFCGKHSAFVITLILLALPQKLLALVADEQSKGEMKKILGEWRTGTECNRNVVKETEADFEVKNHINHIVASF